MLMTFLLCSFLPLGAPTSHPADDQELGQQLAQSYKQEIGIAPTHETDAIQIHLQKIIDQFSRALPHSSHYTVVFDPSPAFKSAFAFPGHQIVVGGGLLAIAATEDEIANVLAHEIEHCELHQVAERTQRLQRERIRPGAKLKPEDYYGHYTKREELACDRNGVQLAQAAGFSPSGMLTLLESFRALRKGEPEKLNEEQPTLEERIRQMQSMFASRELRSGVPEKVIAWP